MHFSKAEKVLHDNNNFNPPPGYYHSSDSNKYKHSPFIENSTFGNQQRFAEKQKQTDPLPGPGFYFNDRAARIKKRMLDDVKKKENSTIGNNFRKNNNESEIKISSIPSIPKKSATRVYEELAPGILILHEQQNEGANIGPGSYNIQQGMLHKKPIAHKINPERKKKPSNDNDDEEAQVPRINDEIRQIRKQLYQKKLYKSAGINKSMISPSDLCLQVIILRQKLLRSDENPPPGYYYNEKYYSSFKDIDPDLLPEYQLFMGKEERFKEQQQGDVGPGNYEIETQEQKKKGGFIPKQQRKLHTQKKFIPGPGAYKVESAPLEPAEAKGNYPPIFGSGCHRFYSADKKHETTPGPGSYKVDGPRKKKQKYVKIKKNFYNSQIENTGQKDQELVSIGGDKGRSNQSTAYHKRANKNNHVFSSKVERFSHEKKQDSSLGPGAYETGSISIVKDSFNRNKNEYIGQKQPRFNSSMIRPNIGPGKYLKQ